MYLSDLLIGIQQDSRQRLIPQHFFQNHPGIERDILVGIPSTHEPN